ncbi:MAG: thiamine kinase-like enzyme [Paracoccaceae bacterium]|jgi:thiamine kinase-like enzyme
MQAVVGIPTAPEYISSRFLSEILGHRVVAITTQRIGEDEGFTGGELYRISLKYAAPSDGGPTSIIAKFSPMNPALRAALAAANEREVDFYSQFSQTPDLPVPKCYFSQFEPATGMSLLIIEDLGCLRSIGFIKGCSATEAKSVVDALVQIHGAFWDSASVAPLSGPEILQEFKFQAAWRLYPEKIARILPDFHIPKSFYKLCQFIADNDRAIFGHLMASPPITIIHRDTHVDNILFDQTNNQVPAVFLDWQFAGEGKGVFDLAYFLISSIEPDVRREIEFHMLKRYHDALLQLGVTQYSFNQCRRDFLASVAGKIFMTIVATAVLDNSTPHKVAWRQADLTRLLAFCEDNKISPNTFAFILL